jgi:hypothetical protein|tara:strand:+ start:3120 stop:3728 length:609 start_codon:yes stop_codon:yes gene_type:complete
MREVQRKIVDVRNPTHIVLKADEISADDVNNLSDSDNPSKLQIASQTELPNDEEQQGEEVKLERTTGEKVPVIESMSRTTPMDGKSHWDKAKGKYVFDATLKKTRNQLDMLKAPPIENPRKEREYPNDNMSDKEVEELFEEIVDPEIIQDEKSDLSAAYIKLDKLGLSPKIALEYAKQFYGDKGYGKIFINSNRTSLVIRFK